MTSENETLKTNEFLRRRKLRLQQVREQSKDIAKKIRQRAKVESLKQVVDLDSKKQQEYFDRQEKLVKRLELLYARGLGNVGASHQSATELREQDEVTKTDLSRARGKEAAAELRKKRQEKLDQQKKLLDRKLQAREAANELSKEKATLVANKLLGKAKVSNEQHDPAVATAVLGDKVSTTNIVADTVTKSDMATQWDGETVTNDWIPAVPALKLPIDEQGSLKGDEHTDKSGKSKRRDLFALSNEMPSDLRTKTVPVTETYETIRPSLTLVSEHLQNRNLGLRRTEPIKMNKKHVDDISSLKQTILRTRATKAEAKAGMSSNNLTADNLRSKKSGVQLYNHYTRDTKEIPTSDEQMVVRDTQQSEDAYSLAMKEITAAQAKDTEHGKKMQDIRSKVAVTKQTVEKEYKDTMSFLSSLPKDKGNRVTKFAYMDDQQQQIQKEKRQQKMEQEYKKIESSCKKRHSCMNKHHKKSTSPPKTTEKDALDSDDFQYSWMPVPEGDGNLAIHTIPNTVKDRKSNNSVKFSQVDSYHEYRSRHKHTPPTKDTASTEKKTNKKRVKTVLIDKNGSQSDDSSIASNTSSVDNLNLDTETKGSKVVNNSSDAESIVIYKIMDMKRKKSKKNKKLLTNIAKSLNNMEKKADAEVNATVPMSQPDMNVEALNNTMGSNVPLEQINEGIYKVAKERDNFASMHFTEHQETNVRDRGTEQTRNQTCQCKILDPKGGGLVLQWQYADSFQPASFPKSCQCSSTSQDKMVCPQVTTQSVALNTSKSEKEPTPSESTASFKTATNDKKISTPADNGYIKLLNEAGQEAGKLFLGPTGLLEDDAYEVVLQLRKKYEAKEDATASKPQQTETTAVNTNDIKVNETETPCIAQMPSTIVPSNNISEPLTPVPETCQETQHPNTAAQSINTSPSVYNPASRTSQCSMNSEIRLIQSTEDKKEMSDKAIEAVSRPATTTYTQTTNSPIRPMYFHMSSSTSTAYMSPPDMILPRFLHSSHVLSEDSQFAPQDVRKQDRYNRKCRHKKATSEGVLKEVVSNKSEKSSDVNGIYYETNPVHSVFKLQEPKTYSPRRKRKRSECKCRNCNVRKIYKHCYVNRKVSSENSETTHLNNIHQNRNKKKNAPFKNVKGSKLNSVIKEYVNRLLVLNREGVKALEVADQECSSVGTPGSSIINVPFNVDERKSSANNKISLEFIKKALLEQITNETIKSSSMAHYVDKQCNHLSRKSRKSVHKVKSLNISKRLAKNIKATESRTSVTKPIIARSTSSESRPHSVTSSKQSSATMSLHDFKKKSIERETKQNKEDIIRNETRKSESRKTSSHKICDPQIKQTTSSRSNKSSSDKLPETETSKESYDYYKSKDVIPVSMSTQTNQNLDTDLVKLAEDKLQNMEKFANLTEKCTKRLSNLAKVLEEVRKNKSLIYSQISTSDSTDSQSGQKSDNVIKSPVPTNSTDNIIKSPKATDSLDILSVVKNKSPEPTLVKRPNTSEPDKEKPQKESISFLADIPKFNVCSLPETNVIDPMQNDVTKASVSRSHVTLDANSFECIKGRAKPPPALSRIHLKHHREYITPHELSTVIEVDSPMSVKNKTQSQRSDAPNNNQSFNEEKSARDNKRLPHLETVVNPDLLQSNLEYSKLPKPSLTDSLDNSKFQMIDLKQFNEIMLEPFISINEYAKKYNVGALDEGSNIEDIQKEDILHDDNMSSLQSDGSLPDVIAELLKRNIITEPFKFDSASNINSNTLSSESTLSILALSKARKSKKKSSPMYHNKENIVETSDTLSVSSNPDLENAFKKLGMGWASSTLKKTKERLALSSSSNTSSSSLPHFKINSFSQDIPSLITDSVSSVIIPKTNKQTKYAENNSKVSQQQTKLENSTIVKEFLTKELANKITFNKSRVNETEDEFISLFETKMPEGLKNQSDVGCDENSLDSIPSGANRARTSTPVQIYKSMIYHSSSSSNLSNGLFSNVDLSSVKVTPNSNSHSKSYKDDLTIPNLSLKMKKSSDNSKSD